MSFDIFIFYTFSHGLFSFRLQPFNQLHRSFSAGWDVEKPATRPHFSTRVQKYTSSAASVSQQSPHPFFTKNQLSPVNPTYTWGPTKYTMSIFGNFQILNHGPKGDSIVSELYHMRCYILMRVLWIERLDYDN